jgi:hypothetical protein
MAETLRIGVVLFLLASAGSASSQERVAGSERRADEQRLPHRHSGESQGYGR